MEVKWKKIYNKSLNCSFTDQNEIENVIEKEQKIYNRGEYIYWWKRWITWKVSWSIHRSPGGFYSHQWKTHQPRIEPIEPAESIKPPLQRVDTRFAAGGKCEFAKIKSLAEVSCEDEKVGTNNKDGEIGANGSERNRRQKWNGDG